MKGKKAKVILAAYKKCRKYPSTFKLKYEKNILFKIVISNNFNLKKTLFK